MTDKMDICPKCGCDGCYVRPINETKYSYACFGCGFYTTDQHINGEYDRSLFEEQLPELYKDLVYIDNENRCWYPQNITTDTGNVFINGSNKDNWQWSAIKKVKLTKEEKKLPRFANQTRKSDPKTLKGFGKDFIEALDYLGFFDKKD